MKNMLDIDGYHAVVSFDPEISLFRGEFLGLTGGADFYAPDVDGLLAEGRKSLKAFLELCEEHGVAPRRAYSGRFNVRIDPQTHADAAVAAASNDQSLNEWVAEAIRTAARR